MLAPHDISPRLKIQLVLKLKRRIPVTEVIEVFPGSRRSRFTAPVNQHLADAARQPSLLDPFRFRDHHAMVDIGQRGRNSRRRAKKLLDSAYMKYVMNASLRGQLKTNSGLIDELHNSIRAQIASLEFAGQGLGQGGRGPLRRNAQSPTAYETGRWRLS